MTRMITSAKRVAAAPIEGAAEFGRQLRFHARAYAAIPLVLVRWRVEVVRLLTDVGLGSGALAVIGGTVGVVVFMTAAIGVEVGLQGYTSLANIGLEALAGFVSSYANTREGAPVLAGIALTATVGAGFTAQLGSMRVAEEIDALEVMAVPSIPYLISTRIVAGALAVIPLFSMALLGSYTATRVLITLGYGQSDGTYSHYFMVFLVPTDILWSYLKAIVMALIVMSVHCYFGYTATGGPAGVGRAVGRAVRASLICVMMVDLLLDLAIYGGPSTVHVSG